MDRDAVSPRNRLATLMLAVFIGIFGAHRFFVGKIGTGLLQLFTIGGLGIWWMYDIVLILAGGFRDAEGRLVLDWEPDPGRIGGPVGEADLADVYDEIDRLRNDVVDLQDRLLFAERLLAQPDRDPQPGGP